VNPRCSTRLLCKTSTGGGKSMFAQFFRSLVHLCLLPHGCAVGSASASSC
jgi:hypothetical protein